MAMTAVPKILPRRMTVDEFLEWPGDGTGRPYQLVDGQPRAMAPATWRHGRVQGRLSYLLIRHFEATGRACDAVPGAGVVPRLRSLTNMRVPDIAITCEPDAEDPKALPAPVVLIEVLSPANRRETWEAVWTYTTIPTVQEILVLESLKMAGQLLRRQSDASWPERGEELRPGSVVTLESVGFSCPIEHIYQRTHLAKRKASMP